MKQRLLFITHHKLDENNGGCNATKGFLRCFAGLFDDCSLICHKINNPQSYIPTQFKYIPMQDNRSKIRKFIDMYRGVISGHYYFVRKHLEEHQYDVVVIDHTFTGAGISQFIKSKGIKLITIHHNVERDYLRDNSKEKPLLYRYPFLYYCKKSERDCLLNSDINMTVTEHDAQIFQSWYPNVCIHSWGIFEYKDMPIPSFETRAKNETFVITGSLYFSQSLRPITNFITRYWPLTLEIMPNAKLIIAGRNPSAELQALCNAYKNISLIPNPENMSTIVSMANYYICPINAGSGLKLRIFDGLKQGLPILCHQAAASGYESIADKGFLFSYHDSESYMSAIKKLSGLHPDPQEVFSAFSDCFSVQAGQKKLEHILKQENIL